MQVDLTIDQFTQMIPNNKNPQIWYDAICDIADQYNLTTPLRLAHFIAQTTHESNDYTVLIENLNYSQNGLLSTFPTHFTSATALQYARQPQKIANLVYANRNGNGPESSGNGYFYRGRGPIMITGQDNYKACSQYLYQSDKLLVNPDILLQPEDAVSSACWFWNTHNINDAADNDDIEAVTRKVNGGTNGLSDRQSRLSAIKTIMNI